jgi:succinate dehydrogenase / fumarate reductase, cytochrome b subunit
MERPVFLNLWQIRMPISALVSIGHRLAGILLVLLIPVLITVLDMSTTPAGYAKLSEYLQLGWVRMTLFVVMWAFAHHFLAGIRFLLLDFDVGTDKVRKRQSAWLVQISAVLAALLGAAGLWL